ncbi:MAG: type II toxin-antitoxin system HicB family antitoxin [SAR202 cluster bacterium]|jgi:predicted RNase H-like HicB family nuclease|nr:type II toxin-antitoxin system HicB family antitoxin [SAR202 cluster bacterium]|tara:strand:- start:809 stop:1015 length:207 start_codon:yes stop_codon:yes gene_type:complete
MKRGFTATVSHEGEWHVAQCLEVDIANQGATEDEALTNLAEALALHFEAPTATSVSKIRRIEVDVGAR